LIDLESLIESLIIDFTEILIEFIKKVFSLAKMVNFSKKNIENLSN